MVKICGIQNKCKIELTLQRDYGMVAGSANNNRNSSQNLCQCDGGSFHIQIRLHLASSHDTCKRLPLYNYGRDVSLQVKLNWKPIKPNCILRVFREYILLFVFTARQCK